MKKIKITHNRDRLNKKYAEPFGKKGYGSNNMYLADGLYKSMNDTVGNTNNNVLLLGRKRDKFIHENIKMCNRTMIIEDIDMMYYSRYKTLLQAKGYRVLCLNLREGGMDGYNPMSYIKTELEIMAAAKIIMRNMFVTERRADLSVQKQYTCLLSALIGYIVNFSTNKQFSEIPELLEKYMMPVSDDKNRLDHIFAESEKMHPNNQASYNYNTFRKMVSQQRYERICADVMQGLFDLQSERLQNTLSCKSEAFSLQTLSKQKTAVFIIPGNMAFIVPLFYTQSNCAIQTENKPAGKIPVQYIISDRYYIPKLPETMLVAEPYNISTVMWSQTAKNITSRYGKTTVCNITNICDDIIYTESKDETTENLLTGIFDFDGKSDLKKELQNITDDQCIILRKKIPTYKGQI